MTTDHRTKRRTRLAAAAMTLSLGAPLFGMSPAGAQSCNVDLQAGLVAAGYTNGWLQGGTSWQVSLGSPLVAGDYNFVVTATDDHSADTSSTPPQTGEHFYLEFVDASGNTVGATPTTPDVPDTGSATDSSTLTGTTTLSGTAVAVRIIHNGAPFTDSVWPGCMGMALVPPPTTTSTTTTTEAPTTTTTSTTSTTSTVPPTTASTIPPTSSTTSSTTSTTAQVVSVASVTSSTEAQVVVKSAAVTLPETGSNHADSMTVGAGSLILLGSGLVLVARRQTD